MLAARAAERRRRWGVDAVAESLDCRLAGSTDDLDGAFRLQHDEYVEARYMEPHPTGRRVTRFNALPGTRVFVAKDGRRVVAPSRWSRTRRPACRWTRCTATSCRASARRAGGSGRPPR